MWWSSERTSEAEITTVILGRRRQNGQGANGKRRVLAGSRRLWPYLAFLAVTAGVFVAGVVTTTLWAWQR